MANVRNFAEAFMQAVADELVAYRTRERWTQKRLYETIGLDKGTMIRIERGRQAADSREIALIADALGFEPQELMQRAKERADKQLADGGE